MQGLERIDAGGWLLLVAALLVIAPALLLPAWREVTQLRAQKRALAAKLTATHDRTASTHRIISGIENADPLVLTRLAWHELHLKPAGARPLGDIMPVNIDERPTLRPQLLAPAVPAVTMTADAGSTVLGKLVAGPHRPAFFIVGAALAGAGLLTSLRKQAG